MVVSIQGYTKVVDKPPRRQFPQHQLDVIVKYALDGGRGACPSSRDRNSVFPFFFFLSLIVIKQDFGSGFLY